MSKHPIRVILVDDHKIVRDSWRILLENNQGFSVVADCDNGHDAIEYAQRFLPDIMLVDINMSPLNGFEIVEKIAQTNPGVKIIALSVNNQPRYATKMLSLGAKGYLTKTSSLDEIIQGIIEVHEGHIYICKEIRMLMQHTK